MTSSSETITPNLFEGSDSDRIQAAVDLAATSTHRVVIPAENARGGDRWVIDRAILLPSGITVVLDNCIVQQSDDALDNIFRSDNVGVGVTDVRWNRNISIVGVGTAVVSGADNPRSTGGSKTLDLEAAFDSPRGRGMASYGTDAGKEGVSQIGGWRNHGILMAYVDGFRLHNVTIRNAHCMAISHERVVNAELSQLRIFNPPRITVEGTTRYVANRDGINLWHGCKNVRIHDVSGETGDDFIALTLVGLTDADRGAGRSHGWMATTRDYVESDDDIEDIHISNIRCVTKNHGVAVRTVDVGSIHHVYIDGLTMRGNPDVPSHQTALLFGGRGYGPPSPLGKIHDVYAMNLMGDAPSALIHVEAAIADCHFMNGLYSGEGEYLVSYHDFDDATPKYRTSEGNAGRRFVANVVEHNLVRVREMVGET